MVPSRSNLLQAWKTAIAMIDSFGLEAEASRTKLLRLQATVVPMDYRLLTEVPTGYS